MLSDKSIIKKILGIKGIGYILLALAAGIILLVLPSGSDSKSDEKNLIPASAEEYTEYLEKKTKKIVNQMTGKSCTVMITLKNGYSYAYANDIKYSADSSADGTVTKKDETREYVVVTVDGDGQLVLTKEIMPVLCGIAVICPDGSYEDVLKITETLKALYGLSSGKISVQT